MPSQEVAKLAALASDAAARTPNRVEELVAVIRDMIATSAADPFLLAGVLIEGLAATIGTLPTQQRSECEVAAIRLIVERLRTAGRPRASL